MTTPELWVAKIEKDGEVESNRYEGRQEAGDEGVITSTYDDIYWAVRRTKEEAKERVWEMWNRRVRDETRGEAVKPEWRVFLDQLSVEIERDVAALDDEDMLDAAANVAAGATFHRLTQEKGWENGRAFSLCTDFVVVIREHPDEDWADELKRVWLDHHS